MSLVLEFGPAYVSHMFVAYALTAAPMVGLLHGSPGRPWEILVLVGLLAFALVHLDGRVRHYLRTDLRFRTVHIAGLVNNLGLLMLYHYFGIHLLEVFSTVVVSIVWMVYLKGDSKI